MSMAMATQGAASDRRPIAVDDLFALLRLSDAQISPSGEQVAYVVGTTDPKENTSSSTIWLAKVDGGEPRQLTTTNKKDKHPRWSPDGTRILFESNRSGENQLWVIDVRGGEARPLTTITTEASNGIWSPDGAKIAFLSAVLPELSTRPYKEMDELHKKRKEEKEKNPVKARVFDRLFIRHWDSWVEDKRQHLFVMPAEGGEPRDVTPGDRDAYPTSTTFSVGDDFTFSPDSRRLVFTATPAKDEAWSTNFDVCEVSVEGGEVRCLTQANPAADGAPAFSPDGKRLAYRAQAQPMYEADKWNLMVAGPNGENARPVTTDFDHWVESFVWSADNRTIYFLSEENGRAPIFAVDVDTGAVRKVFDDGAASSLSISADGKRLAFLQSAIDSPPEVWIASPLEGRLDAKPLTAMNAKALAKLDLSRPKSVSVPGAGGATMQMFLLEPPGFDPSQKWPLVYLVHGGPQGAWQDGWSWRWNPAVWAAQGYLVAMPNPRGSTGFGQKYVREISGDWGGKCFEDLMAGIEYLEAQPYIDRNRMAAAGASFGGYMMNWFAGHTDKFKTLVNHCGVYNFDSMYATTEELWFDEWEHGGPPWGSRAAYEKHSPHRFAANFKTPMLIIHNDLDFRVPVSEGLQMFTTLQRQGVPSKFINFPDEGHWVLKPANSKFWHEQIFAWLREYVPPGGR